MLWKEVGNVQKIYVCHDDITGIFSAVYDAWKERRETGDAGIAFKGSVEQKLFCEYTECEEREEKVIAVEKKKKERRKRREGRRRRKGKEEGNHSWVWLFCLVSLQRELEATAKMD